MQNFAQPPAYAAQKTTTGTCAIINNNISLARDLALADALQKAVEQTVGTMISSSTVMQNFQILKDRVFAMTDGYISNYKILSEEINHNMITVTILATVLKESIKNDLSALGIMYKKKNMPKILIMVAEKNVGKKLFNCWWGCSIKSEDENFNITEGILASKFVAKGFIVVDHKNKIKSLQDNLKYNSFLLSDSLIKKMGKTRGAEIVVYGKTLAKSAGVLMKTSIISANADITLKVVNTGSNQIIAFSTTHASAVHTSGASAGIKAIKNAAENISEKLIGQIVEKWGKDITGTNLVQIIVSDLTSYKDLVNFKEILKNKTKSVNKIYQRQVDSNSAKLDLEILGGASSLADELSMLQFEKYEIRIIKVSQSTITVNMKKR